MDIVFSPARSDRSDASVFREGQPRKFRYTLVGLPVAGTVEGSRGPRCGQRGTGSQHIAPSRSAVPRVTPAGQGVATHYLATEPPTCEATVERYSLRRQYCQQINQTIKKLFIYFKASCFDSFDAWKNDF